ncbi:macrophage mannose receptor 1-like [Ptychodera flava]|uniref:macrophage mannose receptor 1-like n=1 Tax=Ptychodera flava TaxID=63121 RepID=UPI00396A677F
MLDKKKPNRPWPSLSETGPYLRILFCVSNFIDVKMAKKYGVFCVWRTTLVLVFLCSLARTIQAQPDQEEHCISDNYCYQPSVCAYVFTFHKSGDGQCPAAEEAVTNIGDIEADLELLYDRSRDLRGEIDTVKSEHSNTQQLIFQLNNVINDLEVRVDAVEDNSVDADIAAIRSQLQELEQGLEDKDSKISQLREDLASLENSEDCERGWLKHGDGCYFISLSQKYTFDEARSQCHAMNSELVIIDNEAENSFLKNVFQQHGHYSVYIGMTKGRVNPYFSEGDNPVWLDGTMVVYSDWDDGEPNDWNNEESCIEMKAKRNGRWNDLRCSNKKGFVCEKHKQFRVFTVKKSHSDAVAMCQWFGMVLAKDTNDRKHQILKDLIEETDRTKNEDFWINGKFTDDEYVETSDEGILHYSKWAPNEPTMRQDHCVQLWAYANHYWDDTPCDDEKMFICERKDL